MSLYWGFVSLYSLIAERREMLAHFLIMQINEPAFQWLFQDKFLIFIKKKSQNAFTE